MFIASTETESASRSPAGAALDALFNETQNRIVQEINNRTFIFSLDVCAVARSGGSHLRTCRRCLAVRSCGRGRDARTRHDEERGGSIYGSSLRRTPAGAASAAKNGEAVKRRLLELFGLCSANRAVAAAAYFVYRGPDGSRKWKDTLNPAVASERREAADICLRIKGYLDASSSYEFRTFHVEREPEGKWNVWEVWFRQGDATNKVIFALLSIKGRYSIGDID